MGINYKSLVENWKKFPVESKTLLKESLKNKAILAKELDFGRLFEQVFGFEEFRACRSSRDRSVHSVFEAAGAVSTSTFKDISGQIVYQSTLDAYENEEFVFSKIIPERTSIYTFEKVPGITGIGPGNDDEWIVEEGQDFQTVGVSQDWINMPETQKRGKIVPITREAIFFDRTQMVQDKCSEVGYWLGYNSEMRAIDCIVDENGGAKSAAVGGHRYHWRDTSYATYGDSPWDNLAASNALVDWTSLNAAEQLLNEMVDPNTGAPFLITPNTIIVTKQLEKVAMRIAHATEVQAVTPGFATSANPSIARADNPYAGYNLKVLSSRLLAQRMATKTSWFFGNPEKAFARVVNFPFQTTQAPPNNEDEFKRDIVTQFRTDVRDAYGTVNPRLMAKSTA